MTIVSQVYDAGTVTVTNGSKLLSGTGTAWLLALVESGLIEIEGSGLGAVKIDSVSADSAAMLKFEWPGPDLVGVNYTIFRETAQAADAIEANAQLIDIARKLRAGFAPIKPDASGTLAERDAYDDEAPPFFFLRDADADPPIIYSKLSSTSADWSDGWTPKGDDGEPGADGTGDGYDIIVDDPGRPGTGEGLLKHVFTRPVTFSSNMAGSRVVVGVNPTAAAEYSLTKNDVEFATLTIATDGTPTFDGTSSFAAGDVFRVIAPNPRDDTLSGVSMTFAGNRA